MINDNTNNDTNKHGFDESPTVSGDYDYTDYTTLRKKVARHRILAKKTQNDIINARNEADNMSFVGIIKCKEGFYAFADERSTRYGRVDSIRPFVKKIFSNDSLILVTSGNNEIFDFGDVTPLEQILNRLIEQENNNLHDFVSKFKKTLDDKGDTRRFDFIALEKDKINLSAFHFENCQYYLENYSSNYEYRGATWILPLFKNSFFDNYNADEISLDDIKKLFYG